jgi:hypothetical protein
MTVGYIASTIPAKVVSVSGTTLFNIAMLETGDPMQWVAISELNNQIDPWITARLDIYIPPVLPNLQLPGAPFLPEFGGGPFVTAADSAFG